MQTLYKTILVDDEQLAINRLKRLLRPFKNRIEIIYETTSSEDALEKIKSLKPDLVFLDIQMPVYSGFEVLEKLKNVPLIIFVTAYEQYALKAFETNSIDYLLKPVEPGRIQQTLDKIDKITGSGKNNWESQIKNFLKYVKESKPKKINVKLGNKILLIPAEEVYYFKASDKYVEVFTYDKKYLITASLNELEEEYQNYNFVRIHRSYLINLNFINSYEKTESNDYKVRLSDSTGSLLPISRYLKHNLRTILS